MPHWRLLSAPLSSMSIPDHHCNHSSSLAPGVLQLLLPPPRAPLGTKSKLINWASFGCLCQTTALSVPEMQGWDAWADLCRANRGEFISLGYASPLISPSEACLICFEPLHSTFSLVAEAVYAIGLQLPCVFLCERGVARREGRRK